MSDINYKNNFTDFDLDTDAYVAFDATNLRDLIIDRLNDQNILTDQIFEGSNISSMIDIVAYSYHVLLFYLNRTANESIFSESMIYENMNRIVKMLNYKPTGYQTSTLTFTANVGTDIQTGFYTIPRYSFVNINGIKYSIKDDISFAKTVDGSESVANIGDENLLFQGEYIEYPVQQAAGIEFETFVISADSEEDIESSSIDVYVRSADTGLYTQYKETESLFLETSTASKFEKRLNEDELFEVKFGNGVNGSKLNSGDEIYIYYLKSDGDEGVIQGAGLANASLVPYTTMRFTTIFNNIKDSNLQYLSLTNIGNVTVNNTQPSTTPVDREAVSTIRANAPSYFKSQSRLITANDFRTHIKRFFGNIITDVSVVNNNDYVTGYIDYLDTDLDLTNPNLESRLLLNQVNFGSNNTFNNVYVFVAPRLGKISSKTVTPPFSTLSQKQLIKNSVDKNKILNSEIVFADPVYTAFDLCVVPAGDDISVQHAADSNLVIVPEKNFTFNKTSLIDKVYNIIATYFENSNSTFGKLVSLSDITKNILDIDGVYSIYTSNGNTKIDGLSMIAWNPVYPADISVITQDLQLPYFKFPYMYDTTDLKNKITTE